MVLYKFSFIFYFLFLVLDHIFDIEKYVFCREKILKCIQYIRNVFLFSVTIFAAHSHF